MKRTCFIIISICFSANSVMAQYRPVELIDRIHLVPQPETLVYKKKKIAFPEAVSVFGLSLNAPEQRRTLECLNNLFARFPDVSLDFDGNHPFKIQFIRKNNLSPEGYELVSTENGITIYAKTASGTFEFS